MRSEIANTGGLLFLHAYQSKWCVFDRCVLDTGIQCIAFFFSSL